MSNYIYGRVLDIKRRGVSGVRVKILDRDNQTIGESVTNSTGNYNIWLDLDESNFNFLRHRRNFTKVVAFDTNDKVIGESGSVSIIRRSPVHIRVNGVSEKVSRLENVELEHEQFIDVGFYQTVHDAISVLTPKSMPSHSSMFLMALCPLPPLFKEPSLMRDIWGTINLDKTATPKLKAIMYGILYNALQDKTELENLHAIYTDLSRRLGVRKPISFRSGKNIQDRLLKLSPNLERELKKKSSFNLPELELESSRTKKVHDVKDEGYGYGISKNNMMALYSALFNSTDNIEELSLLLLATRAGLKNIDKAQDLYKTAQQTVKDGNHNPMLMMLSGHGGMCGPDDGPHRGPIIERPEIPGHTFIPQFTDEELRFMECMVQGFPLIPREVDVRLPKPHIEDITPPNPCSPRRVTIKGTGFHPNCTVRFSNGDDKVNAQILSFSSTQLTVRMPFTATDGPVNVVNPGPGYTRCGYYVPSFLYSNEFTIGGGRTVIHSFDVVKNGQVISYAKPGETVQINWRFSPQDADVKLTIHNGQSDEVHTFSNQSGEGSFNLAIPSQINTETTYSISLEVNGTCGVRTQNIQLPISVKPDLGIKAVEVTQGIQNFSISEDGPNDVDLISSKGTVVRVYVSSDREGFNDNKTESVTGKLVIGGTTLHPINGQENTRISDQFSQGITAVSKSELARIETDHSLNFFIPASLSVGTQNLHITIWSSRENAWEVTEQRSVSFGWIPEQSLLVRWFRVNQVLRGDELISIDSASFNFERALDLMPSSYQSLGPAPIWVTTTRDFADRSQRTGFMNSIGNIRDLLIDQDMIEDDALFAAVLNRPTSRDVLITTNDTDVEVRRLDQIEFEINTSNSFSLQVTESDPSSPVLSAVTGEPTKFNAVRRGEATVTVTDGNNTREVTITVGGIPFGTARRPGFISWSQVHYESDSWGSQQNSGRRITTAHELAHNLGFSHVGFRTNGQPTPGQANPNAGDTNHPNNGFLEDDDVYFDCYYNRTVVERCYNTGTTNHICGVGDFMSYFRPRRTSRHQWVRMIDKI